MPVKIPISKMMNGVLVKLCRHKDCLRQREYQPVQNFNKSKREKDGYQYKCRCCESMISRKLLVEKYRNVEKNPDGLQDDIKPNLSMFSDKYFVSQGGVVWNLKPRFPIGQRYRRVCLYSEKNGYITCGIEHLDGKTRKIGVHRLVAIAHIPNPENKPQVNHKNGDRADNRVENLEWVTPKENVQHAKQNGWLNPPIGERQGMSKINPSIVRKIRASKLSQRKLAKMMGIGRGIIQHVLNGTTWKHVK